MPVFRKLCAKLQILKKDSVLTVPQIKKSSFFKGIRPKDLRRCGKKEDGAK